MDPSNNALLNALGAYDSDSNSDSSSNSHTAAHVDTSPQHPELPTAGSRSSSPASFIGPDLPPADHSEEEAGSDQETMDEDIHEHTHMSQTHAHSMLDQADHATYHETKHNLDLLLGCDKVLSDLRLSPENAADPPVALQQKFSQWYDLRLKGASFNETLMRNKTFRNPNIYRWLVDHLKLEECGSNLHEQGFDPAQLRRDFTPAALAEDQERRAREYAAKKNAQSAAAASAGTFRKLNFQQSSDPEHSRSGPPSAGSYVQQMQMRAANNNAKTFNDALERAKLIAQHLSRGKGQ
ncbi:SAP30-binding protein [Coemansia sp. RSA 2703]|nr:SAP30-binding protein [Coemansia sp. RSA 2703]KAJ2375395.1 SAP30-binding protein [Coemansia sp. RSA 2607]KAJ2387386.1 SAP30-binding protein [Coemansia sp. RSA 2603]